MEKGIKNQAYTFISHISRFNYFSVEFMPAMNMVVVCFDVKTMFNRSKIKIHTENDVKFCCIQFGNKTNVYQKCILTTFYAV